MFADLIKFTLGLFLAMVVLAVGGAATALYLMNRTSAIPPKPVFVNDSPTLKAQVPKTAIIGSTNSSELETNTETKKDSVSPKPTPTPSAAPKTAKSPKPLPPGAYGARVTWRQGLVLRGEPKQEAERFGSVAYNQKIFVLEQSADEAWQKIRTPDGKQEGWVKAGNTKKDDEQKPEQADDSEQQR